ncbi:MAG: efflux RND transporter periplasmic adaptor subunit [Candidatus Krumholzibacteria bacterium]|nr:efflux RND transporter periplasmic adaptor subunit [Candidatus Krumholzibacteria bacterium]
MKRKSILIVVCMVAAVAVGIGVIRHVRGAKNSGTMQFGEVKRGDIVNTVSSTGTVNAVNSVNVGAQVSGIINKIYVDFNSEVKAGQVLAVLDTTIVASQVFDARAGVLRSRAQLNQAQAEYDRNKPLYDKGYLSATEFITIKTNYDAAVASNQSAEAALKRALRNLEYTTITSPIDGTVIQRSVDAGQTIQASFQAPTLFIIATDLKSMQIDVNVDESDIGVIREGQRVEFAVQAYPDDKFTGTVRQVRLQSAILQNVVNYTDVVDASNESGKLLPGMTATVDFIIEEKKGVLLVPNAAIQFKPDQAMLDKIMKNTRKDMAARHPEGADSSRDDSGKASAGGGRGGRGGAHRGGAGFPGFAGGAGASNGASGPSRVFYMGKDGEPAVAFFVPGATDGRNTEVKESRVLVEGMQVITEIVTTGKTKKTAVTPFGLPTPPRGGGGHRGGF